MLGLFKRLPFLRGFPPSPEDQDALVEEKWTADFSKPKRRRFPEEDSETYMGHMKGKAYELTLKKNHVIAWVECPFYRYTDTVVETEFSFKATKAYVAAGIQLRRSDDSSYYTVLVSNHGYFRIDAIFNGSALPLVGWTEVPGEPREPGYEYKLRVIAFSDHITVVINNIWAGAVQDGTLTMGRVALTVACYDEKEGIGAEENTKTTVSFHHLSIESRAIEVESIHLRWNTLIKIDASSRDRLAETFLAMAQPLSALIQLKLAWKTSGAHRSQNQLLLGARCAISLSLLEEAEDFLDRCIEADPESDEGRKAMAEKAKMLYLAGRYTDLRIHGEDAVHFFPEDVTIHTLLGHAYSNLGMPRKAVQAYDRALELDNDNGLAAWNAGEAYERIGDTKSALARYIQAGKNFLNTERYKDLSLALERIHELDPDHPEGHALAGKYAFAVERWTEAERELKAAEKLRGNAPEDPAIPYLQALLLIRKGRRNAALSLLERAVSLADDYGPFRFRLAECRYILKKDPRDPQLLEDLAAALRINPEDPWTNNLAAQIAMVTGDLDGAAAHLDKASSGLKNDPTVLVNRSELCFLQGKTEAALALLNESTISDTNGRMMNQKGSILYRMRRTEEAEASFRAATALNPGEVEYLQNQAICLIDLGAYGEADEILSKAYSLQPRVELLELISYVAAKKGEYPRAEAACRIALEEKPKDLNILSSLAWLYITMGRWESAEACILKLESQGPHDASATQLAKIPTLAQGIRELRQRYLEGTTKLISCDSCERTWRVPLDPPVAPSFRLVAEPPEDLPAGTCPICKTSYCIGCGKKSIDSHGHFICPKCGERLKLFNEGLKKLIADWAAER